jgi:hypothetical protein
MMIKLLIFLFSFSLFSVAFADQEKRTTGNKTIVKKKKVKKIKKAKQKKPYWQLKPSCYTLVDTKLNDESNCELSESKLGLGLFVMHTSREFKVHDWSFGPQWGYELGSIIFLDPFVRYYLPSERFYGRLGLGFYINKFRIVGSYDTNKIWRGQVKYYSNLIYTCTVTKNNFSASISNRKWEGIIGSDYKWTPFIGVGYNFDSFNFY